MYDGMMHGTWMWLGGLLGVLFALALLTLLVLLAVWLYRQVREDGPEGGTPGREPLEILKTRYAKGEISEEEYRRMKEELS